MTRASDIEKPQKFIEIQLRRLMLVFVIFQIFSDSDRCRTCIGECVGQVHGRGAASGNKNAWPVGSVGSRVGVSDPDKAVGSYVEAEHRSELCIGCGGCSATCTAGNLTEFNIRKLQMLVKRGETKEVGEHLQKCMLCGKCLLVCPRGVDTRRMILTMLKYINSL